MCQYVTIAVMPKRLTADDLDAVKRDPLCEIEDKDELYKRIGWLICAYDAIVAARLKTPNDRVQAGEASPATTGSAQKGL